MKTLYITSSLFFISAAYSIGKGDYDIVNQLHDIIYPCSIEIEYASIEENIIKKINKENAAMILEQMCHWEYRPQWEVLSNDTAIRRCDIIKKIALATIEMGVDPNLMTWNRRFATDEKEQIILLAARNNMNGIVYALIKAGADTSVCDVDGSSVLHLLCAQRRNETLKITTIQSLLKEKYAHLNTPDSKRGFTPLVYAVFKKEYSLVELLLQNGANPDISFITGHSFNNCGEKFAFSTIREYINQKGDPVLNALLQKYSTNMP